MEALQIIQYNSNVNFGDHEDFRANRDTRWLIQYTSEFSDIIEFQYQLYHRSDIDFWDRGGAPPPTPPCWGSAPDPSLWRGSSLYAFNHDIYAQKP